MGGEGDLESRVVRTESRYVLLLALHHLHRIKSPRIQETNQSSRRDGDISQEAIE